MIRSAAYLAYVRSKSCMACARPAPSDAHHYGDHGTGIKADDYDTVPLCRGCHNHWHAHGCLPDTDREPSVEWMLRMQLRLLKAWTYKLEKPDDAEKEIPKIYPRQAQR